MAPATRRDTRRRGATARQSKKIKARSWNAASEVNVAITEWVAASGCFPNCAMKPDVLLPRSSATCKKKRERDSKRKIKRERERERKREKREREREKKKERE